MNNTDIERKYIMRLEEIDKAHNEAKQLRHDEARKMKLDNGLYRNTEVLEDSRNIDLFDSKYKRDFIKFEMRNPDKTERHFVECKIEEKNTKRIEIVRVWNLSNDEYYYELSKDKENIDFKKFYLNEYKDTTEDEFKTLLLNRYKRQKPSEFEDWELYLYERKLKELPKIKSNPNTTIKKDKKYSFDSTLNKPQIEYLYTNYFSIYFDCNKEDIINLFSDNITTKIKTITTSKRGNKQIDIVYFFSELKNNGFIRSTFWKDAINRTECIIIQNKPLTSTQITTSKNDIRKSYSNETVIKLVENVILDIPKQENTTHTI